MSILSTTNTGLQGPVTENFLLSLGLEKHKFDTGTGYEMFAFYNKDILPITFRITFYNRYDDKDNPGFQGTLGDHSIPLKSKEKVLLYLNYVKLTKELQNSFISTEALQKLIYERVKFYNEITK